MTRPSDDSASIEALALRLVRECSRTAARLVFDGYSESSVDGGIALRNLRFATTAGDQIDLWLESEYTVWLQIESADGVYRDDIPIIKGEISSVVRIVGAIATTGYTVVRPWWRRRPTGIRVRAEGFRWYLPALK